MPHLLQFPVVLLELLILYLPLPVLCLSEVDELILSRFEMHLQDIDVIGVVTWNLEHLLSILHRNRRLGDSGFHKLRFPR